MKKILILSNDGGGLISFRRELISLLAETYAVTVCIPDEINRERIESLGAKVIVYEMRRRSTNPVRDLKLMKTLKAILRSEKPDLALTYTIKPNVYGGMVCRKLGIPYLANVTGMGTSIENGGFLARISLFLYRQGLKGAACVFFQNSSNHAFFVDKGILSGKARIVPGSGVNLSAHPLRPYPEDTAQTRFLFIGRIMKDKGIEELLYAISALHEQDPTVCLDIVGRFDEAYQQTVQKAEEGGFVKFHGPQIDVNPFIWRSHCVVLPSYHEGMSNVMLEAASCGRPVITTTVPGCAETFDEGVTGFGCKPGDGDSLLAAMNRFLSLSHQKRAEMGLCGRKKMCREFDRKLVIDAYLEEIRACIP